MSFSILEGLFSRKKMEPDQVSSFGMKTVHDWIMKHSNMIRNGGHGVIAKVTGKIQEALEKKYDFSAPGNYFAAMIMFDDGGIEDSMVVNAKSVSPDVTKVLATRNLVTITQ